MLGPNTYKVGEDSEAIKAIAPMRVSRSWLGLIHAITTAQKHVHDKIICNKENVSSIKGHPDQTPII